MNRVLCIDGGGMRGYLPAAVLVELERRSGRPCCELFEAVWGTSIGGVLAGLVGCGVPAREAIKFFTEDGPAIFEKTWRSNTRGFFEPRYRADIIEERLRKRFGSLQTKTRVAMTAFDLGGHVFWDGGNVANNPSMCALADAMRYWGHRPSLGSYGPAGRPFILSLGCGAARSSQRPYFFKFAKQAAKGTGGVELWQAARATSAAQTYFPAYPMNGERTGIVNAGLVRNGIETLSALFEAANEEVDYQMTQILGDHYIRIQPRLAADLPLDDASPGAILNLRSAAANCVRDSYAAIETFLQKSEIRSQKQENIPC
jgi:hypothetical protein